MALVLDILSRRLQKIYRQPPKKAGDAAKDLAEAYARYARTVTAGAAIPTFLGTEEAGARRELTRFVMRPEVGSPVIFALAWQSAIDAFWLASSVPVLFGGAGAGPVQPATGGLVLLAALTAAVQGEQTAASAAVAVAVALDAYTRTFAALLTPPGASVFLQ